MRGWALRRLGKTFRPRQGAPLHEGSTGVDTTPPTVESAHRNLRRDTRKIGTVVTFTGRLR
jgi:hypothetical protein